MKTARFRWPGILVLLALLMPLTLARAQEAAPEASPVSTAEGAGPVSLIGTLSASNFALSSIYQKPTFALLDLTSDIPAPDSEFAPIESQILGFITAPLFQQDTAGTYQIDLPIAPSGETITFGDGSGVQVFKVVLGNNIYGSERLEQIEQEGSTSARYDNRTGAFLEGNVLVYAADDQALFPIGAGEDGAWFTEDDELQALEPGYSAVHLALDGAATVDRNAQVTVDIVEDPARASADFSGMGILESFNALIDRLAERYSWTELRGLDWEAIRAEYLPMVEEADANGDYVEYAYVLVSIADSVKDSHVTVYPTSSEGIQAIQQAKAVMAASFMATIGAVPYWIPDPENPGDPTAGTVQIIAVGESGPAHDAGWVPGTEIISIDGKSIEERRAEIPLGATGASIGTEANYVLHTSQLLLNFAPGQEVTIEYKQPGEDEVRSATMVAGTYPAGVGAPVTKDWPDDTAWHNRVGDYTVIHWNEFTTDFPTKVAIFEEALRAEQANPSKGIILDMRGNGGGWEGGNLTLASYFFAADEPFDINVFDTWTYDEIAGGMVKEFAPGFLINAVDPELAYTGPLYILVDQHCASSCEFFSQELQKSGRATVIGLNATAGAGGNVDRVNLPGGLALQFTVGRSYYAGTEEPNIEGKGVTPDIWLPLTVETLVGAQTDPDFVLNLAIEAITPSSAAGTPVAMAEASPMTEPEASPVG
ncbi:MAG: hypothetical protein E6R14_11150 [Thermomicrobiales bacterium]|nr:MAG: hypothetical protein E6R14_11150 [Thermomicrobiales bacterium]